MDNEKITRRSILTFIAAGAVVGATHMSHANINPSATTLGEGSRKIKACKPEIASPREALLGLYNTPGVTVERFLENNDNVIVVTIDAGAPFIDPNILKLDMFPYNNFSQKACHYDLFLTLIPSKAVCNSKVLL